VACGRDSECVSRNCVERICCSASGIMTCWRDRDGDGFGDGRSAERFCRQTCPSGYVANKDDCFDENGMAHPPSRTRPVNYQDRDRGDGSFDYDCDGTVSVAPPKGWVCRLMGDVCENVAEDIPTSSCGTTIRVDSVIDGAPESACLCRRTGSTCSKTPCSGTSDVRIACR